MSVQFETSMLMETFCTNPLNVRNFSLTLKPDFTKLQTRYQEAETISFLNLPPEVDEDSMTQFVQQYAVVIGHPGHPSEDMILNTSQVLEFIEFIRDANTFPE